MVRAAAMVIVARAAAMAEAVRAAAMVEVLRVASNQVLLPCKAIHVVARKG